MRPIILALGLLAVGTAASAQTAPLHVASASLPLAPLTTSAEAVADTAPTPAAGRPIGLDELASLNGKQGETVSIAMTDQDLNAVNHGNTVSANTVGSGQITIGAGAYQGFAGVGNFVINSGHNNNLQGALTINIVTP